MSSTILNLRSYVNGRSTDLTSIKFQDMTATYGLRRTDTGGVIVASGVDWTRLAIGYYQYVFTDPASDLIYEYVIRILIPGNAVPFYYSRNLESSITVSHVYTIPDTTHYSSEAEIMRFMGELATSLMTEDWEPSDKSQVWGDILDYIDETVDMMLGQKYDRSEIISNSYVRRRATIMAAYLLSMRRGNPAIFKAQNDQILDEFKDIQTGVYFIPNATPFARNAPVVRNYVMQPLLHHPQRVIRTKSTGASYARVDSAFEPYIFVWG